ncbi:ankyrin repeat-containing domain protein [Russula brevipes]|nr:ankyrin repeat-containing domain protein [Russula brevipes]
MVQLLLSHGADINAVDRQGRSPLHKALRSRNIDVVKLLLTSGADVNARDRPDLTPLFTVLESGDFDMAQLLLSHGADINALMIRGTHHYTRHYNPETPTS